MAGLDVVGIGNALVDVTSSEEESFLDRHGLVKGTMALIDASRAERLYSAMGTGVEVSGGQAANTMAGLASFGGDCAFIGRIADDQLGAVFAHDMAAVGVAYHQSPSNGSEPTGRCLVVVTPDGERTLNTFLGASAQLGPDDVGDDLLAGAALTYLEGYLLDAEAGGRAFDKAVSVARGAGRRVALNLSDVLCVERHQLELLALVEGGVDVLFANDGELSRLYGTDDADAALTEAAAQCEVVAMTRGAAGCSVVVSGERHDVPAEPVARVLDTNGAGDLFAAGFLFGLSTDRHPRDCARLGAVAAAEIISHFGSRPEASLADLAV
ncbi:MAG: adenosine kinase [Actinomycetota bacterium]|nr:adenosine kinase [Actinomycetota bacterium]